MPGGIDAVGRARRAAKCSQVGDGIVELSLFSAGEASEQDENSHKRNLNFHSEQVPLPVSHDRPRRLSHSSFPNIDNQKLIPLEEKGAPVIPNYG
jgi:hypothetical protein